MSIDWDYFEKNIRAQLDKPYKFGAKWPLCRENPDGPIDCSGFVSWAYSMVGKKLPDGSRAQYLATYQKEPPSLGYLGFFAKDKDPLKIHHVGILLNSTDVIEARGEPYNKVIIRPRANWEKWKEFIGWMRPNAID